jgi:small subunit ribosomal protein S1
MDRKGRTLQLSIKAKDEADTAEAMAEYNKVVGRRQRDHQAGCPVARAANSNKSE